MLTFHLFFFFYFLPLKVCFPLEAAPVFQELCSVPDSGNFGVHLCGDPKISVGSKCDMMMLLTDLFSCWGGTQGLSPEPLTVLGTLSTEQEPFLPKELLLKHSQGELPSSFHARHWNAPPSPSFLRGTLGYTLPWINYNSLGKLGLEGKSYTEERKID